VATARTTRRAPTKREIEKERKRGLWERVCEGEGGEGRIGNQRQ